MVGSEQPKSKGHSSACVYSQYGEGFGSDSIAIPDEVLPLVKLFQGYAQYSEEQ
jgi:hypothetical protein